MSKNITDKDFEKRRLRTKRETNFERFFGRRPSLDERPADKKVESEVQAAQSADTLEVIQEVETENNEELTINDQIQVERPPDQVQKQIQDSEEQSNQSQNQNNEEPSAQSQIQNIEERSDQSQIQNTENATKSDQDHSENPIDELNNTQKEAASSNVLKVSPEVEQSDSINNSEESDEDSEHSAGAVGGIANTFSQLTQDSERIEANENQQEQNSQTVSQNNNRFLVLWTPNQAFRPNITSTDNARPRRLFLDEPPTPRRIRFNFPSGDTPFEGAAFNHDLLQNIFSPRVYQQQPLHQVVPAFPFINRNAFGEVFHSAVPHNQTNYFSAISQNISQTSSIEEASEKQVKNMAFTATQYVELIPKCNDEKTVEQFISIVDGLYAGIVEQNLKTIFVAVVRSKILGKAFNAIKGKKQDTWEEIKTNLVAGLEDKIDSPMASNKLMQIRQKKDEALKDYISRIKEALAELDKVSIRNNGNEEVQKHVLQLNDATAKNTFEFGLWNKQLKTIVVAAQKKTFIDSQSFAVNQHETNFPDMKEEESKNKSPDKKTIICYYCNKKGHTAPDCRTRIADNNRKRSQNFNTWRSPKKEGKNSNSPRQYYNRQTYNSQPNNNSPPIRPYSNNNERPQWNNCSDSRANENARQQSQYNNKQNGNREFNNTNRNPNQRNNEKSFRVLREGEINWEDIAPTGEDVCDLGN